MLIDPAAVPRVAVDSMNDVHLEEVHMLNAFADELDDFDGSPAAIDRIDVGLAALARHQRDHFASEEELMAEVGFPATPMHQQEHERLLGIVAGVIRSWETTRDVETLRAFFRDDLTAWIANHIQTMDTITAQFVAAQRG